MFFSIIFLVTVVVFIICGFFIRFRHPKLSSLSDKEVKILYQQSMIKKINEI